MEGPFSPLDQFPDPVVVETCAAQGPRFDLEGWGSSRSRPSVETGSQHAVHNLLEGLARPSSFGPELGRYIVVQS
jgi:hypothetical protein